MNKHRRWMMLYKAKKFLKKYESYDRFYELGICWELIDRKRQYRIMTEKEYKKINRRKGNKC